MRHTFWFHLLILGTSLCGLDFIAFAFFGLTVFNPTVVSALLRAGLLIAGWITWAYWYTSVWEGAYKKLYEEQREEKYAAEKERDELKQKFMPDEWAAECKRAQEE